MRLIITRSSHCRCSVKRGVLKNFANDTGKYLCWSLFLIMLQGLNFATFLKRDSNWSVFLWSMQIFRTPILKNICKWLLLYTFLQFCSECENIIFDIVCWSQVTCEKITKMKKTWKNRKIAHKRSKLIFNTFFLGSL